MTTVTGKLIGAANPQRVEMRATLVDVTGKAAVGYVSSVPGELVKPVAITADEDGDWTVTLTANSLITSDAGDTLWAIQEGRKADGNPILTYVVVPETGGPYWAGNIRGDLSDTTTGGGTVVYLPGPAGPAGATGAQGEQGPAGPAGAAGAPGESAYQAWLDAGNTGTEADFLASLIGPQGEPGSAGDSLVTSVNGQQGAVVLDAADVGADVSGAAAAAQSAAVSTASSALSAHAADATGVHGIPDTALLETLSGAQTKADAAQSAATTAAATDATSKVTAHTAADDPHGYKTWADAKFATITTVNTLNGYVDDTVARIAAVEGGTAWLAGLNIDGDAQVVDGALVVRTSAGVEAVRVTPHATTPTITMAAYPTGPGTAPTTGTQLADKAYVDAEVASAGGGATIRSTDGRIDAQIVVPPVVAGWAIVTTSGGVEIGTSIPASIGDVLWFSLSFLRTYGIVLDVGIKAAGGGVSRYVSSGTSTPETDGYAPIYPQAAFGGVAGMRQFIVQEGEVDGSGNAKIVLVYKGNTADGVNQKVYFGGGPGYSGAMFVANMGPQPAAP